MALLERIAERRSLENPQTPLGSDLSWGTWDGFDGPSTSGVKVSRRTALSAAAVWRGVNLIARDVGKLRLDVMRRVNGGWEVHRQHPARRIVARKPNPYMTTFQLKQVLTAHAVLEGNGYAYIYRTNGGDPLDVLPLSPSATYPIRVDGKLWYVTSVTEQGAMALSNSDGVSLSMLETTHLRRLRAEDVIHIRGLGYDGLVGYPVLQYAKETIGAAIATRTYRTIYFKNNAAPNIVLEYPGQLTPEAITKLRDTWNKIHAGLDNSHKTAILQSGMKLKAFSQDARKAQLIEAEQFEVREVANVLGIPPHKLGDPQVAGYGVREQDDQRYLDECLLPWLVTWEEELEDKLLTEDEKETEEVQIRFRLRGLIRGDMAARAAYYHGAIQDGWMSRDEVRAEEELNPMPNDEGKKYFVPLNMGTTGGDSKEEAEELAFKRRIVEAALKDPQALALVDVPGLAEEVGVPLSEEPWKDEPAAPPAEEPPMPTDASDPERSYRMLADVVRWRRAAAVYHARCAVRDAWHRMNRRIAIQARSAAKKPEGFVEWVESIDKDNRDVITDAVAPAERCLSAVAGVALDVGRHVENYFKWLRSELLTVAECKASDLPKAVERWAKKMGA